jgi:hypothetical protein
MMVESAKLAELAYHELLDLILQTALRRINH